MNKQCKIMWTVLEFLNWNVEEENPYTNICSLQAPTVNHNKSIGVANVYSLNTQMIAIVVNNSCIKIVFYAICISI